MNIAVLIKQVPVSDNVSVDPETHALIRSSSEGMINPADRNAIEAAIVLKEQTGGKTVVFTMGPPNAEKALREAMAIGCDESCLITDRCFGGGDTVATAKVIAKGIEKYGSFDLIIGGAMSSDGATGQVGAMAAEYLGIPHISEVSSLSCGDNGNIIAEKRYQGMQVKIKAVLPALVTVNFGCNEPRMATLRSSRAAKTKPLATYTNAELCMAKEDTGLAGSPTVVTDSFEPEHAKKAEMLTGSPAEMAARLKELIDSEKGKE